MNNEETRQMIEDYYNLLSKDFEAKYPDCDDSDSENGFVSDCIFNFWEDEMKKFLRFNVSLELGIDIVPNIDDLENEGKLTFSDTENNGLSEIELRGINVTDYTVECNHCLKTYTKQPDIQKVIFFDHYYLFENFLYYARLERS